jgi:hypothetical protein
MRTKLFSGLAALALIAVGNQPALAAAQCMQAAERTAFDVRALQSQLMIAALTCGQQDDYNTFIQRHQRALSGAHQQIASHFDRMYGSAGEQQLDTYITNLANAQSQEAIRQGSFFCRQIKPLFQKALTLQNTAEISRLATEENVTNPYLLATCVSPTVSVTPDETIDREINAPAPVSGATELAWAGTAMQKRERDGRDTETRRLETKLSEATKANELLEQRIHALESSLSHRQQRR